MRKRGKMGKMSRGVFVCVSSNEGCKVPWLDANGVYKYAKLVAWYFCMYRSKVLQYTEMSLIHPLSASVSICSLEGAFPR